ncbi:MAG: hypothetical protein HUJ76_10995, partial [Parasporobacterium sp.]|nr:hypothetical protein [Parasporobacterium sp.]
TYLEANRCDITVKKPGYATFSDEGAVVVFNDCNVNVASHAGMIAGKAKIFFNNTKVDSGRNGFLLFAIGVKDGAWQIAEVTLNKCDIHTKEDLFAIKGTNAYLDLRGSNITVDNNCLIRTEDNSTDIMASTIAPGEDVYGIKAVFTDMEAAGDIIHGDPDRGMMVRLLHATLKGAVQNAWLDIDPAGKWYATADSVVALTPSSEERIDAPEGVTIIAESESVAEHKEIILKSGGKLVIN